MSMFRDIFSWWHDATLGTRLKTLLTGRKVGEDEFGNRYYEDRRGRRWIVYRGTVEASRVPPDWHGWLHHTFREPPTVRPLQRRPWEKAYQPNLTGTDCAYHPPGSLARADSRAPATGDYEAWRPG